MQFLPTFSALNVEMKPKVPITNGNVNTRMLLQAKSLYRSRAGSHFYRTEMRFGLILCRFAIMKKKLVRKVQDAVLFKVFFFMFSWTKKIEFL